MTHITFGRYEILRELGRGAMGVVYEAHDPVRGVEVALKVMTVAKGSTPDSRKRQVERFNQEAKALGALAHHGVVHLYDQGEVRGRHYFAMELVRGTTLKDRIHMQGPLAVVELVRLAIELCEILEHVHENGVIHRDIKPENIMLMPDGTAKLMDFGIAQLIAGNAAASTGGFQGSPAYMSPEQVGGKPVDRRSDIYSLGVTLYEAASGKRAVSGETIPVIAHQVANDYPPQPPGLPPFLNAVLMRALAKDPDQRYQYAGEMIADLRASQAGLPLAPRTGAVALAPAPAAALPAEPPPPFLGAVAEPIYEKTELPEIPPVRNGLSLGDFAGEVGESAPAVPACTTHTGASSVAICTQCRAPICYSCLLELPTRGILCRSCAFVRR